MITINVPAGEKTEFMLRCLYIVNKDGSATFQIMENDEFKKAFYEHPAGSLEIPFPEGAAHCGSHNLNFEWLINKDDDDFSELIEMGSFYSGRDSEEAKEQWQGDFHE